MLNFSQIGRTIYNTSKDAIMLVIPGKGFIAGNPATLEIFGCKDEQEFVRQSPASLSSEYQPDGKLSSVKSEEMMAIAMEKGAHFFEWTHKRLDGKEFFATVLLTRMELKGEKLLQATVRDITEIKKAGEELERKNVELRRLDQLKSEFVSTISHELRTPLSITKEGISLVLDGIPGKINDKQKKILDTSSNNIDRLARIINTLLDISKIEAGKVELKRELVDIVGLVNNILLGFQPKFKEKGLECKPDIGQKEINVYVDPDRIAQVFTNLIGNAMKFTPQGGEITVCVKESANEVECSVCDTGVGIAEEDLPKVFEKFQQFNRTAGSGEKGTGLGLSIVKAIVEMHKGKIRVESKLGAGTKFTFTLPKYTSDELFREYVTNGIKDAVKKDSQMALILVSILESNKLQQALSAEKLRLLLKELGDIIKNNLRREGDVVVKDTGELIVVLADCNKENALVVGKRLQEGLKECLAAGGLENKVELKFGYSVYPLEAKNDAELIQKAKAYKEES